MAIWKLEPVEPGDHNWRASQYVGTVFVRARNKDAARLLAMNAFGISPELQPDLEMPRLPWYHEQIVTCERVVDSDYNEEGPDEILGPEDALAKARPVRRDNG